MKLGKIIGVILPMLLGIIIYNWISKTEGYLNFLASIKGSTSSTSSTTRSGG